MNEVAVQGKPISSFRRNRQRIKLFLASVIGARSTFGSRTVYFKPGKTRSVFIYFTWTKGMGAQITEPPSRVGIGFRRGLRSRGGDQGDLLSTRLPNQKPICRTFPRQVWDRPDEVPRILRLVALRCFESPDQAFSRPSANGMLQAERAEMEGSAASLPIMN